MREATEKMAAPSLFVRRAGADDSADWQSHGVCPRPDERRVVAFSWFDGTSWGYGQLFPLPAAVLTAVSLLLLVASCLTGRGGAVCFGFLIAAAAFAVMALLTANARNGWGIAAVALGGAGRRRAGSRPAWKIPCASSKPAG